MRHTTRLARLERDAHKRADADFELRPFNHEIFRLTILRGAELDALTPEQKALRQAELDYQAKLYARFGYSFIVGAIERIAHQGQGGTG